MINKFAKGAVYSSPSGNHTLTIINRYLNLDTNHVTFDVVVVYKPTNSVRRHEGWTMSSIVDFTKAYKLEYVDEHKVSEK